MTCQHCVKNIREALEKVAGVELVEVTLKPGQAVIQGTAAADALIQSVKDAGYEATPI
jgi:copper chaperone